LIEASRRCAGHEVPVFKLDAPGPFLGDGLGLATELEVFLALGILAWVRAELDRGSGRENAMFGPCSVSTAITGSKPRWQHDRKAGTHVAIWASSPTVEVAKSSVTNALEKLYVKRIVPVLPYE